MDQALTDAAQAEAKIQSQVVRFALELVADDMASTLMRTARSTVIKEVQDLSCALYDRHGRVIVQSNHAPMLLAGSTLTMGEALKAMARRPVAPGDLLIANDPYRGGQHLMDVAMLAPVFRDDALIGYVGAVAHHSDLGGASPGGVAGGLRDIFSEGLCFPFGKLYVGGRENPDLFDLIEVNIRAPHKTLGDIRAQAAACFTGVRRYLEVIERFGLAVIERAADLLIQETEARLRAGLTKLPDGTFVGEDVVDDDGITDQPIPIKVIVTKRGDALTVDLTECGDQVAGNVNCPLATTLAAVQYVFVIALDHRVAPNHGCFSIIDIKTRHGSVVDPKRPAGVSARTNVSLKVQEATLMALAKMLPGEVMAPSHAQISHVAFVGTDPASGRTFVYNDIFGGGAGARPMKDGRDAQDTHLARFMNTPTEMIEHEYPVRVHCYELVADTGGPGTYRGALALAREVEVLTENTVFSRYGDRQRFPVKGAEGGGEGKPGAFILNPRAEARPLKSKGVDELKRGDIVRIVTPGGGGFGAPECRDPALIADDLAGGKVTEAHVAACHGAAALQRARQILATRAPQRSSAAAE
jgi:N-methylhydantoinase B